MSRSLLRHLLHGALGFALVSIAAFAVWAFGGPWFRGRGGEPAMYAAITAVFLGLSGAVLAPLAGGWGRFYRAFLPAFGVYALVWSLAWFSLLGLALTRDNARQHLLRIAPAIDLACGLVFLLVALGLVARLLAPGFWQ